MDTTLRKYQGIHSHDVTKYATKFIDYIASYGGEFGIIFHNESIGGDREWSNWGNIYENILQIAVDKLR